MNLLMLVECYNKGSVKIWSYLSSEISDDRAEHPKYSELLSLVVTVTVYTILTTIQLLLFTLKQFIFGQ